MKFAPIAAVPILFAVPAIAQTSASKTASDAYNADVISGDEIKDDPTDRRVLNRLNTRVNGRLQTRIERQPSISVAPTSVRDRPSDSKTRLKRRPNMLPTREDPLPGDALPGDRLPGD